MNSWAAWTRSDVVAVFPEILLLATGIFVLLLDAVTARLRVIYSTLGLLGIAAAWVQLVQLPPGTAWGGTVDSSPLALVFSQLILAATLLTLLAAPSSLRPDRLEGGEFPALVLWGAAGISIAARATDLVLLFVALEVFSVALYGLAAFNRKRDSSLEAGLKYFIMGAFISAFVLYGIALLYGETGSTTLAGIGEAVVMGRGGPGLLLLGALLVFVGFGFKLTWVPFHAWAPDVYQGAPTASVVFLAVAPKIAAAVVIVRWAQLLGGSPLAQNSSTLLAFFAVASMVAGTLFALVQRDLKRMLAYSGIAHMGYLAIPLVSTTSATWQPVFVYLFAYLLMNFAAFALVGHLAQDREGGSPLTALAGMGFRAPALSAALTVSMLSLAGIPPTFGFIGKYLVFLDAVENGRLDLALVGVATSLVGAAFYLRVIYFLYMKPELEPSLLPPVRWGAVFAIFLAVAATAILGIWPQPALAWVAGALARS